MAADILAYLNQKEFPTCRTRASSRVSPRETALLPPLLLETIPRTPLPGPLIRLSVSLTVTPSQPWSDLLRRCNTLNCGCRGGVMDARPA